jgi:hypothetical protein
MLLRTINVLVAIFALAPGLSSAEESRVVDVRQTFGRDYVIHYAGPCVKEPVVLLETLSPSARQEVFNLRREHFNAPFLAHSRNFAEKYRQACSLANGRVRFAIDPMPRAFRCSNPQGCFIVTTLVPHSSYGASVVLDTGWETNQLETQRDEAKIIRTAEDAAQALAAGDDTVESANPTYFNFYFQAFLEAYSDHCAAQIAHPVTRVHPGKTLVTRNGYGTIVREAEIQKGYSVVVESEIASQYDSRYNTWVTPMALSTAVNGADSLLALANDEARISASIRGKCTDARIRTIYQNLKATVRGLPTTKGRYPSRIDQLAASGSDPDLSSAPDFARTYREARASILSSNPTTAETAPTQEQSRTQSRQSRRDEIMEEIRRRRSR